MKQNIFITAALMLGLMFSMTSCSDIMETDSDIQIIDPALDSKTDSLFYTVGILQGLQQLADQYVLVNEMRGDLVATNSYTETDLRELSNFSISASNKYDSTYIYYRVINNCNYYIANRDTTLQTGSRFIAIPEYAEAKAIRAWAYLQLAKLYGKVPFFTKPIKYISQLDDITETKDIQGICDALGPDLSQYVDVALPTYGNINAYNTNAGENKTVQSTMCMFPASLVLGDMYLEASRYAEAAQYYFHYLRRYEAEAMNFQAPLGNYAHYGELPMELLRGTTSNRGGLIGWGTAFRMNNPNGVITYIPMAVNRLQGTVTALPRLYGYNFFYSPQLDNDRYVQERQLEASTAYEELSASQSFYYMPSTARDDQTVKATNIGDMRRYTTLVSVRNYKTDSIFNNMMKFNGANIPVYRNSTIYLRLAEAINRMGYPDAAFAILKDGLNNVTSRDTTYMRPETIEMLTTTLPFFSSENRAVFENSVGIHSYGCGYTAGTFSPYQYTNMINEKAMALKNKYGVALPDSIEPYSDVAIDVVEDLICDEYALELAFEGTRFGDLCRLARHKNLESPHGANWGGRWLAGKLAFKNPVVDLTDEKNWYLPFEY